MNPIKKKIRWQRITRKICKNILYKRCDRESVDSFFNLYFYTGVHREIIPAVHVLDINSYDLR